MKARHASRIHGSLGDRIRRRCAATLACLCMLILMAAMTRAPLSRAQSSENIGTFAADCSTPQTSFNLGDAVCAVAPDAPLADPLVGSFVQRRFEWVTPDGGIFKLGPDVTSNPQSDSITIPATGALAQVGTWTVKTVDASNDGHAFARFVVLDPAHANVDLWCPISAPFSVSAGSDAPFTLFVTNKGPNDAANVQVSVTVATNSTFQSETQVSGPAFTCTNPPVGSGGSSTCTIASLPANTTAQFTFVFQVDGTAAAGAGVTSTATVSSDTNELFDTDNTFTASASISQSACTISCPSDITQDSIPVQCGAVVNFTTPTGSGSDCGTVVCTPPSGSVFPIGVTSVVCAADSGGPCAFTVTIRDAQAASITCPANITVDESSPGFGLAVVNYPGPALNDGCPVPGASCNPPSGSSFPVGTTTVNCHAVDNQGAALNCSFTITVNSSSGSGCTISCPQDIVQAAAANQCTAVVTYSPPTTSGPCGSVVCSPPSGSTFASGTTAVSCTVNGGPSCGFLVTVIPTSLPVITTCPANTSVPVDAFCEGVIPNLLPQVVATGCNVILSQSPVAGSIVPAGIVTVTITAENGAGLATCAAIVRVDNTPPTITCQADINADFDPAIGGALVTYTTPVGSDNCSPTTTQIAGLPSGSVFPPGNTTNTFLVTDAAGLTAQCSFKVTVALTSLIGLDSVSITGSGLVDSYASSGGYPATKGSLTNVLSNGTITLGNSGKVFGNVRSTRAGVVMSGASQVTGNAVAGTTVSRSGSATVGGTITNNLLAPVITLPLPSACGPPYSPNSGITGTYSYNPSTGDLSLSGVNIATLANGTYCFHNVTLTNSAQLKVNGPVVIKITGTLNVSGATSLSNTTGIPGNLWIVSSYSGSNGVSLGNSSNVQAVIYAPRTDVSISGASPFFGAVIGKTLTISNSGMIHYDTLLKNIWPDLWLVIGP